LTVTLAVRGWLGETSHLARARRLGGAVFEEESGAALWSLALPALCPGVFRGGRIAGVPAVTFTVGLSYAPLVRMKASRGLGMSCMTMTRGMLALNWSRASMDFLSLARASAYSGCLVL